MDSLSVTGRKRLISEQDDQLLTPKKARVAHYPLTPTSISRTKGRLPTHLQTILNTYVAIEDAIIPALASGGVAAPVTDELDPNVAIIPNVLTHVNVPSLALDSLKRLVYILEWDPDSNLATHEARRGGNGLVVSLGTYLNRSLGKRIPAYALGIQVDLDLEVDKRDRKAKTRVGMNSVTRWLEKGEERRIAVEDKLRQWVEYHRRTARESKTRADGRSSSPTPTQIPVIPQADLPPLNLPPSTPSKPKPTFKTPAKATPLSSIPFPPTPAETPTTNRLLPSPETPELSRPSTPSTVRRDALRERIRQRSLQTDPSGTGTPSKTRVIYSADGQARRVTQEELRRRCVLGRLEWISECVASLFSNNPSGMIVSRRRVMKIDEVVRVVVKSAKSPLSDAEATESLEVLMSLCPTFLTSRVIDKESWLEMPSIVTASSSPVKPLRLAPLKREPPSTPKKPARRIIPASPGSGLTKEEIEEELLSRERGSPKRIRAVGAAGEVGEGFMTLRDVRERIRRELEKGEIS